jgi:bifunctional non-homologous end joining protein LigD
VELKPIIPFEPVVTDAPPSGERWIAQVKWDGVRVLTYVENGQVKLFNRKKNERTHHYPELAQVSDYCTASSVILDGEVIAWREGKPSFYEVMKRDGLRQMNKVPQAMKRVPITYMVFDLLYLNGEWMTDCPLAERQAQLNQIIRPVDHVRLVPNFTDVDGLYEAVRQQGLEGIVVKDLTSAYVIGGKDGRWRKQKVTHDLIAVVGGVTFRGKVVNSLLLGLYDNWDRLHYIGHAGTGKLTQADWRDITKRVTPLVQTEMPFYNRPERISGAIWVTPLLTVKVNYLEWVDGHSLRQPSIQGVVDADPLSCRGFPSSSR